LVPQLETGKINCVRLPHCDRLPPGGKMRWFLLIWINSPIGNGALTCRLLAQSGHRTAVEQCPRGHDNGQASSLLKNAHQ
jgi:hypothetical protein